MWHTSTGNITYDPYRGDLKKKKHWWAVVTVDREITRYYRWWIQNQYHTKGMCQPSWDAHISVIRGERPSKNLMHLWKKYHNQQIEFQYKHEPYSVDDTEQPGKYWMVDVECSTLLDIRSELNRPTNWKLHMTVGRTWFN